MKQFSSSNDTIKHYGKIMFLFVFILFNLIGISQNTIIDNPFDIPNRKEKQKITETKKTNEFDIQNRDIQTSDTTLVNKNEIINSTNPFEVSHIPLKKKDFEPTNIETTSNSKNGDKTFIFWITLFLLALFGLILNVKSKILLNIFKSVTNENVLKLLKREERNGRSVHYLLLYLIFLVSTAIFIFLVIVKNQEGPFFIKNWVMIFLGLTIFFAIKYILYFIVAYIFPIKKEVSLFSFSMTTYNILAGICFIPINLLVAFGPDSLTNFAIWAGLAIFLTLQLFLYIRGLLIAVKFVSYSIVQFFIYLCTLEIAPIVLVLKVIKDMFI